MILQKSFNKLIYSSRNIY